MPLTESEGKVLLALIEKDPIPIMSLPESAQMGGNAVYNAIRKLLEKELVTERREEKPPRKRLIGLTENGKRVAELLRQIEREL